VSFFLKCAENLTARGARVLRKAR